MAVSLKTDLRFPESGQHGHGSRIIHTGCKQGKTTFLSHMSHDFGIYRNKKYVASVGDIIDEKK